MIRLIDERVMEKLRDKPENIDLEEFLPLVGEWREDKASKAKCPYCVKPIEKQATKCNHCLSEIEWFKFDGLYGPCKAGASEKMENALAMARATLRAAIQAEKAAAKAREEIKFTDTLAELEKEKCYTCNKLVFTSEEIQNAEESGIKRNVYKLQLSRRHLDSYYKCCSCTAELKRNTNRIGWITFIAFILILIALSWVTSK
ncbi:hypothetical protein OAK59_01705 [Akkermansiaceae bacterium]|nr:hypothetical protein [Akkermansiaceae bacterium]